MVVPYGTHKFKDDIYSKKIKEILNIYEHESFFSVVRLNRTLIRLYRNYKWNSWKIKDSDNHSNKIIGFNYMNPCWNSLETLIL